MLKKQIVIVALICLSCVWLHPGARAQTETRGALTGRVQEEGQTTGIANARVRITNSETGAANTEITNAAGGYKFNMVRPGKYNIAAEADGYTKIASSEVSDFVVPQVVLSELKPPPLQLRKLGAPAPVAQQPQPTTTTIAPPAVAPPQNPVNLEDATRSASFDDRALLSLPLFGNRSFDQLALLAAGVAPAPQALGDTVGPGVGPGVGTSGQFAVNGLRSRANNFTVDGSDNNDEDIGVRRQGFTALVPQSVESVEGFLVITLLPRPQFGRNLGAQVNAVSRGGSQAVHGTLYGFVTDSRLKVRDAFDLTGGPATFPITRKDGKPVLVDGRPLAPANPVNGEDPFTRAQYGFVISGPAAKRDTFFFGSFERRDLNARKESNFAVPTVAERGLFGSGETGLTVTAAGRAQQVFPTTVVGDAFFSLFPFPNNPRGPYGVNTYTEVLPARADGTILSFKLERNFRTTTHEHTLTGRYNFTDDATTLPVTGEALFSTLRAKVRTQNLSLFFNSSYSAALSNEARFSYGRTRLGFTEVRNPFLRPSQLGRDVPFLLNARKLANSTFPIPDELCSATCYETRITNTEADTAPLGQVIVSGYNPLGVDVFNFPQTRVNNTFQVADTVIYSLPRQQFVFGGDFRRTQLNSNLERNFRSQAVFGGTLDVASRFPNQTPLIPQGRPSGFYLGTDFVAAGAATGFTQTLTLTPDATIGLRFWQNNLFISDQIAVRPNFKLTLGLRYELNTVPREANDRIESTFASAEVRGFIEAEKRLPNSGGVSGFENYLAGRRSIYAGDHNNFAPHIAFAWSPGLDRKTAVRGGYGIYYDQIPGAVISQSRSVFPRFLTINLAGISPDGQAIAFNPQLLSRSNTLNVFQPGGPNSLGATNFLDFVLRLNRAVPLRENYFPAGPGFVLPAAKLVTPYSQHWSLAVERELPRALLLALAYVGTKGTHLLRQATPNLGPNVIPVVSSGAVFGDQINFQGFVVSPGRDVRTGTNFRRPFPLLGAFTSIESDANSSYHSLQASASLRLRQAQLTSAYTWSHAIDEVSDLFDLAGARALPQNSFDRRAERGNANFDVRHRFAQSFIWDLPFLTGNKLLGGWQLAGIVTLQTGQPFTVLSSIDVNLDGNLTDRPNTLAGVSQVNDGALRYAFPGAGVLDAAALTQQFRLLAGAGFDGAIGRNTLRAPGVAVVDLAVNKLFRFTERQQLEWRTEIFNLFNRTHYGIPVHVLFAPGLGSSVNTTVPALTLQFALRYKF